MEYLAWPPQSPDLNPIENVWAVLKRKLYQFKEPPKSKEELIQRVEEIWLSFGQEFFEKFSLSLVNRIKLVIKSKGNKISY